MPDENLIVTRLEIEVEAELSIAESSAADIGAGPSGWAFDPTDVDREEVGLRNLLGAVTALETDGRFPRPAVSDRPAE